MTAAMGSGAALPAGRVHFVGVGGIHMSALAGPSCSTRAAR